MMNIKEATLSKMFISAHNSDDYSSGYSFMRILHAINVNYESDEYFNARHIIHKLFGEQEATSLDNAFVKSSP